MWRGLLVGRLGGFKNESAGVMVAPLSVSVRVGFAPECFVLFPIKHPEFTVFVEVLKD